jgi:predicted RNA binding protein YcfA (HicA-like mRNA interferase family)
MKTRELVRRLLEAGFRQVGKTSKHTKYKHPDGRYTVVSKGNNEIEGDLLKRVEKQTKLKLT